MCCILFGARLLILIGIAHTPCVLASLPRNTHPEIAPHSKYAMPYIIPYPIFNPCFICSRQFNLWIGPIMRVCFVGISLCVFTFSISMHDWNLETMWYLLLLFGLLNKFKVQNPQNNYKRSNGVTDFYFYISISGTISL